MALKYWTGAHTKHRLLYHLVWIPKCRTRVLQGKVAFQLRHYLYEACKVNEWWIEEIRVMPDHVHMSVELPLHMSSSKALQLLKGGSSYLLFRFQPKFRLRYPKKHFWSTGGYAASVGYTTVDVVDAYVRNQRDIHQKSLTEFVGSPAL